MVSKEVCDVAWRVGEEEDLLGGFFGGGGEESQIQLLGSILDLRQLTLWNMLPYTEVKQTLALLWVPCYLRQERW